MYSPATLFHELTVAHEVLSDPIKRDSYDKEFKARAARAERFKALDSKRKNLAEDLVAREEAYKKARREGLDQDKREQAELNRLREEGERLRKAREQKQEEIVKEQEEVQRRAYEKGKAAENELGPLDTTVRLKWQRKLHPALELDKEAIASLLPGHFTTSIESIVISGKMASNPKLKMGTAMIALKTLSAAVKVVEASGRDTLNGIEVTWAAGQEPEMVRQAREREQQFGGSRAPSVGGSANGNGHSAGASSAEKRSATGTPEPLTVPPPLLKAPKLDENDILAKMRAREREREKLEEDIRRQDEEADQ